VWARACGSSSIGVMQAGVGLGQQGTLWQGDSVFFRFDSGLVGFVVFFVSGTEL
jgi:hypothetical protein